MTLIYSSSGFLAARSGSPISCASPLGYCPDYVVDNQTKHNDNCSARNTTTSFDSRRLAERMKNTNIRLSLEDVSKCMLRDNKVSSPSCIVGMNNDNKRVQRKNDETPRSILKKAASADSASIAKLREALLLTKRLSISLSDTNLSQQAVDDNDDSLHTRPRSPSKNVTFADDNNLSLVKIHNFVPSSERLDQWQFNTSQTNFRNNRLSGNEALSLAKGKVIRRPVELLLCFKEPCDSPDFTERFKYKCVALERCATRDRTLTGIILVKNIEFEKHVSVRYTVDGWKTTDDVEAYYVPNSNDGETDRFSFTLSLPKSYKEMEFAIRFKTNSSEFWDNNFNRNYKVRDALSPP